MLLILKLAQRDERNAAVFCGLYRLRLIIDNCSSVLDDTRTIKRKYRRTIRPHPFA